MVAKHTAGQRRGEHEQWTYEDEMFHDIANREWHNLFDVPASVLDGVLRASRALQRQGVPHHVGLSADHMTAAIYVGDDPGIEVRLGVDGTEYRFTDIEGREAVTTNMPAALEHAARKCLGGVALDQLWATSAHEWEQEVSARMLRGIDDDSV